VPCAGRLLGVRLGVDIPGLRSMLVARVPLKPVGGGLCIPTPACHAMIRVIAAELAGGGGCESDDGNDLAVVPLMNARQHSQLCETSAAGQAQLLAGGRVGGGGGGTRPVRVEHHSVHLVGRDGGTLRPTHAQVVSRRRLAEHRLAFPSQGLSGHLLRDPDSPPSNKRRRRGPGPCAQNDEWQFLNSFFELASFI